MQRQIVQLRAAMLGVSRVIAYLCETAPTWIDKKHLQRLKTMQTDTQDAVAAMERSTQGVVDGARLSDAAGTALADIDRVTRQLSELIAQISNQALSEARQANVVASNIQHIFAVTEQTGEGTRSTAAMVRELSRTAEELKASVARFKID